MKRKIQLIVLLISWLGLVFFIQPSQGTNTIVNIGLIKAYSSHSQLVYLEADNYTITVHTYGTMHGDSISYYANTQFYLQKDSSNLFVYSKEAFELNETISSRLTIKETGNYTFSFYLNYPDEGDYVNYEIIITEVDLIIHPKTSIISEAPYGLVFMLLAVLVIGFMKKRSRNY